MLVTMNEIMDIAESKKIAIAAFNVPTLDMVRGVIQAAEELNLPVIIQHTEGHAKYITLEEIAPIMIRYAKEASVPVCVHLDHGVTLEECVRAIKSGFTSVMYDASTKTFEENISETRKVVELAHAFGVSVEAELGHMLNSSIGASEARGKATTSYRYTEVTEAQTFIDETGVDTLAIAVGTMHGIYLEKPVLNLNRVKEIKDQVKIPLVLHGGSGLADEDYKTAINNGIRKINYYTYMNTSAGKSVADQVKKDDDLRFYDEYTLLATKAIKNDALNIMKKFANV